MMYDNVTPIEPTETEAYDRLMDVARSNSAEQAEKLLAQWHQDYPTTTMAECSAQPLWWACIIRKPEVADALVRHALSHEMAAYDEQTWLWALVYTVRHGLHATAMRIVSAGKVSQAALSALAPTPSTAFRNGCTQELVDDVHRLAAGTPIAARSYPNPLSAY